MCLKWNHFYKQYTTMTTRVEKIGKTQELSGKTQELSGKYKSTNTECKKSAHLFFWEIYALI